MKKFFRNNMSRKSKKEIGRQKRHRRIRRRITGTPNRPRLSVHRSLSNLYVQLIDDVDQKTLLFASTRDKDFRKISAQGGNIQAATVLGEVLAKKAKSQGLSEVVFDRSGYLYHGRVKALAESARKAGLIF